MINRSGAGLAGPTKTAIIVVITATPTLGPTPGGEVTPTPPGDGSGGTVPTPPGVATPTPTQERGEIQLGSTVEITGTEGEGLIIRQGPGRNYAFFFVGYDGEIFIVEDGPREGDGYIWWYITDPLDPNRSGWAVQDFLQPIVSP